MAPGGGERKAEFLLSTVTVGAGKRDPFRNGGAGIEACPEKPGELGEIREPFLVLDHAMFPRPLPGYQRCCAQTGPPGAL